MSPFLTAQGKWLFISGVIFTLMGAVVREPILILFGQIPFVVLALALAMLMPAARSMDRRNCRFQMATDDPKKKVMTLRRDKELKASIWLENFSGCGLRILELIPFVAGEIRADPVQSSFRVGGSQARLFDVSLLPNGIGRSSLQGFDVVLGDRWGLLAVRDYLPCVQVFETYPSMSAGERRRANIRYQSAARPVHTVDKRNRSGTDLRELRDFQPGDPLRTVAWKATIRQRRLITREFDDERAQVEYIALDISSSMRAGTPKGEKFDHAISMVAGLSSAYLEDGREVSLFSFDDGLYATIGAGRGQRQYRRIQWHLVGLNSVVESGRTALDEESVENALADYLLVQERLDFRHGAGLSGNLDRRLLRRWLRSKVRHEQEEWKSPAEAHGVLSEPVSDARRFFRLRAIPLAPHSEIRPGAKNNGIKSVLQEVIRSGARGGRLTIISDLCGLTDVDALQKYIRLAGQRGLEVRVLAPFTPYYGQNGENDPEADQELIRQLFSIAERTDRLETANHLVGMGVAVEFVGPDFLA